MNKLLIRQTMLDNQTVDVLIEGNRFARIAPIIDAPDATLLDGRNLAIVAPFYNAHGHAAMTLFRGFADDIALFPWLAEHIWPAEALLTPEDVACATRLAIIEMIHSGTVFFNDMYWLPAVTARIADEMGVRAAIGRLFIEASPGVVRPTCHKMSEELEACATSLSDRLQLTYAPHAIYTVSGITLRKIAHAARDSGQMIHIHAAETRAECEACHLEHGMTPIAWLDACGLLGPRTVLAHAVHLTDADVALIVERQAILAHMPIANAKLGSGQFRFQDVVEKAGCRTTIGTDGCASNNSLSMFDEIKCAALSAKIEAANPTAGQAATIWTCATRNGAEAFGIDAGVIAQGKLADAVLIDLNHVSLVPCYNLISNLVYAADSSVVHTVICDGRVLMHNRTIPGEAAIIDAMRDVVRKYQPLSLY